MEVKLELECTGRCFQTLSKDLEDYFISKKLVDQWKEEDELIVKCEAIVHLDESFSKSEEIIDLFEVLLYPHCFSIKIL